MPELATPDWMLIVAGALVLGWFIGRQSAGGGSEDRAQRAMQDRQVAEAAYSSLPPTAQQQADALILAKDYTAATKLVHEQAGLDLRAAKLAVDARKRTLGA